MIFVSVNIFRRRLIISSLVKSWLNLCIEESTCHEMVIHLSQKLSSMLCFLFVFFFFFFFLGGGCTFSLVLNKVFNVDAERMIAKTREM